MCVDSGQDLIDGYLSPSIQAVINVLNDSPTMARVDSVLAAQQVLNMLNTKYLILNPAGQPLRNNSAMGHGWLVENFLLVENADQEYLALGSTDLKRTAVVEEPFAELR